MAIGLPEKKPLVCAGQEMGVRNENWASKARTSLLLLDRQFRPATLHAVTESHPQVSLLLERHALPSLLNVGKSRFGDRVGGGGGSGQGDIAAHHAIAQQVGRRGAQHLGDYVGREGKIKEQEVGEGAECTARGVVFELKTVSSV